MVMKHIRRITEGLFRGSSTPHHEIVEIDMKTEEPRGGLMLHMDVLEKFGDTDRILSELRTGTKIALVKIRPLREKDMSELKRAINRIKTHCAATGGDIAAIDDNWIIVVPPAVGIERT